MLRSPGSRPRPRKHSDQGSQGGQRHGRFARKPPIKAARFRRGWHSWCAPYAV